jgi:hypothetical protein
VLLPASARAAETRSVLQPLGEGRFLLEAPTGGSAVGEIVYFDETPGRPVRLYVGDGWSERTDSF